VKRTLLSLGNSTAVTLPPDLLERLGLRPGDTVEVEATEDGILIRPAKALDPEFERALRAVVGRYGDTLRRLAAYDRGDE